MSGHYYLLHKVQQRDKLGGLPSVLSRFVTHLINSLIKEHKWETPFIKL